MTEPQFWREYLGLAAATPQDVSPSPVVADGPLGSPGDVPYYAVNWRVSLQHEALPESVEVQLSDDAIQHKLHRLGHVEQGGPQEATPELTKLS